MYFSFIHQKNISFGIGGHTVFQPSINGGFFGKESQVYSALEFGVGARVKFLIKTFTLSLEYYHGLKTSNSNFFFFDPLKTLGLKLGYPFQLDKFEATRK